MIKVGEFTLENFLKSFGDDRVVTQSISAEGWLEYYRRAKASFEKYGLEGPPFGSKVCTLRAGFGGYRGLTRTLRDYMDDKQTYFRLWDDTDKSPHARGYLSKVTLWWQDFEVIEEAS